MKNKNQELLEAKKNLVKKICGDFGIELEVSGCGCCGSPEFTFKFNGQKIFDKEESFCFSNLTGEETDEIS